MAKWIGRGLAVSAVFAAAQALAQGEPRDLPVVGAPVPGGVNYQPAVTELSHDIHWLSGMVHGIMALIVLFVMALIAIVVFRFNSRRNPTAASFTHNTRVEIAWTLVPVLILIVIGSFSLPILFKQLEIPESDLTIKATGNQWYWSYEYPDYEMAIDSLMQPRAELAEHGYGDDLYLLATDPSVVVPVGAVVRMQVTGADVIHSWTVPSFGVKMDAVPGRLAEIWFQVEREGIYFGQCSELCGKDHSYMPITVKAVSPDTYEEWLDWAIAEHGGSRPEDRAEEAAGAAIAAEAPEPDAAEAAEDAAADEASAEEPAAEEPPAEVPAADEQATPTEETEATIEAEEGLEAEAVGEAEQTPAEAAEEPAEPAQ
jgi:cytochrome c oxidase subunit 2